MDDAAMAIGHDLNSMWAAWTMSFPNTPDRFQMLSAPHDAHYGKRI